MGEILGTSKVSKGGITTIPKTVREALEIEDGDLLIYKKETLLKERISIGNARKTEGEDLRD